MALACAAVLCFAAAGGAWAEDAALKQADDLDWVGKYKEEKDLLTAALEKAAAPADQAAVNWRLARVTLNLGDSDLSAKAITSAQALKSFEQGEAYADKAIKLNPALPQGYYWKSANMGRWGQTKGILDSLGKAGPMRDALCLALKYDPEFGDAFYILGELYEQVPGFISFGNVDYSVSLGRKAVALIDPQAAAGKLRGRNFGAYIALSNHLWARNWDAKRRASAKAEMLKQFNARKDYVEKHFFYEGTIELPDMSDHEEARQIIAYVIRQLEAMPQRTAGYEGDLKSARENAAKFK